MRSLRSVSSSCVRLNASSFLKCRHSQLVSRSVAILASIIHSSFTRDFELNSRRERGEGKRDVGLKEAKAIYLTSD